MMRWTYNQDIPLSKPVEQDEHGEEVISEATCTSANAAIPSQTSAEFPEEVETYKGCTIPGFLQLEW